MSDALTKIAFKEFHKNYEGVTLSQTHNQKRPAQDRVSLSFFKIVLKSNQVTTSHFIQSVLPSLTVFLRKNVGTLKGKK